MSGKRERVHDEIMSRISNCPSSRNIIRMTPRAFLELCVMLERNGGLPPTRWSSVEDQFAKSLYILTHNVRNQKVSFWFRRSSDTVRLHFHKFVAPIIGLGEKFIVQPNVSIIPHEILNKRKFFPYFKDCVGAIDVTHIRVRVSPLDAPGFHGQKEFPTQNVLALCKFDLKFTYVFLVWEGTMSDSRIIKNALSM